MASKDVVKDFVKELEDMNKTLTEEDKKNMAQLTEMEDKFDKENKLSLSDFNELYAEGVKNFRLDFGTVCEKGRDEVVEKLAKAKKLCQKQKIAKEYLSCVELTRQKAAQRGNQ